MHTEKTGARRSERKPRYDQIPSGPLRRLAARYEGAPGVGGALKYGEFNWTRGLNIEDTLNHVFDHLEIFKERLAVAKINRSMYPKDSPEIPGVVDFLAHGTRRDDDLAAAVWGIFALMEFEDKGPFLTNEPFKGSVDRDGDRSSGAHARSEGHSEREVDAPRSEQGYSSPQLSQRPGNRREKPVRRVRKAPRRASKGRGSK